MKRYPYLIKSLGRGLELEFPLTRLDATIFEYRGKKFNIFYIWNNKFSYAENVKEFWSEVLHEICNIDGDIQREEEPTVECGLTCKEQLDMIFKEFFEE